MDWRDLPSLSALRAYEAAARTGSLSAAARELNVTHVAISQHVRGMEKHFGTALLLRDGQRMVVPEEARPLANALTEGLGLIAAAARDLLERGVQRPVRIATTPSFASGWLMPRMSQFWQTYPEIEVEVLSSDGLVDLHRDRVDIALRYGYGNWRGVASEPLISARFLAVARPGAYIPGTDLGTLTNTIFLTYSPSTEELTWLANHGVDVEAARIRNLSSSHLVIEAVKAGVGIGVLTRAVAEDELARGTMELVAADDEGEGPEYHIVTQPDVHNPVRDTFVKWLKAQAAG